MFTKQDIIQINKQFDSGVVVNNSSLEFAVSYVANSKSWLSQCAYLVRAVLIDHIFEEANKRTAAAVMIAYFKAQKLPYDIYKVDKVVVDIIMKNIADLNKIRRMIKDATN